METNLARMNDYLENVRFLLGREQELKANEKRTDEENTELAELENQLTKDFEDIQSKADNYGYIWKALENDVDILDAEIKRLQARKKAFQNTIEGLKFRLYNVFQFLKIEKIKTALFTFSFRSSQSIEVQCDPMRLPDEFKRIITVYEPDKVKLKDAIKEGRTVEGVFLKDKKTIVLK